MSQLVTSRQNRDDLNTISVAVEGNLQIYKGYACNIFKPQHFETKKEKCVQYLDVHNEHIVRPPVSKIALCMIQGDNRFPMLLDRDCAMGHKTPKFCWGIIQGKSQI